MLQLFSKFLNHQEGQVSSIENENGFKRIAIIHSIGALIFAPLFAVFLKLGGAPDEFVYLAFSYAFGYIIYVFICWLIPVLRDELIYFLFFHLFLITFLVIYYLSSRGFQYWEVSYALPFYIFSVIIIQRLYPAVLYNIFTVALLIYAHKNVERTEVNLQVVIPFFICFGAATSLMIYARGEMLSKVKDYAVYLKKIIDIPGIGFILFDFKNEDLFIIDSNEEARKYFKEVKTEQDLSIVFKDKFSSEEIQRIKGLKQGHRFTKQISIQYLNKKCDLEFSLVVLNHKKQTFWLTTISDVTLQNKKHAELVTNEKKYRNLYFKNKAGVFTLNKAGELLNGNDSFFKMFEKTINEGELLFQGNDQRDWYEIVEMLNESGSIYNYQTQLLLPNKSNKTFLFSWYLDEFSNHIEGTVIDLTNIQKASQAIKQSEEKYRLIFEESNDAILLLKGDKIIEANRTAKGIFSENTEIKGISFLKLSAGDNDDNAKRFKEYKLNLAHRKNIKFNWQFKTGKADQTMDAEVALIEITLENKLFYQCVIHDRTEANKLAKEKMRAEFAEETNVRLESEIKERIKAQKLVQEQFLRTKAILDSSSNTFLLTLNSNQKVSSYNYHCEAYFNQIFNRKLSEGVDFNDYFEGLLTKARLRLFNILFKQVTKGESHQIEVKLIGVNGNEFWMEIFMNPIFDTEGKVAEISLVAHDISEKKKSSIAIVESLKEKEVLLKEIHHRVKNNLQVISSILNLQSSFVTDTKTLNILQESRNRIRSMAIIHENLYQTKDFSSLNFGKYLHNLTQNLITSYRVSGEVELEAEIEPVDLVLDQAIPCGLLVNEIITNSLKYAWEPNEKGIITLKLYQDGKNVILELGDNGKGLPDEFENIQDETLGLQLVLTLSEQLDGELNVVRKNGTKYLLKFENIKTLTDVKN